MRLSELLNKPVLDLDGRRLGLVHDVVATQDGPLIGAFGAALRVQALTVGAHGVAARMGLGSIRSRGLRLVRQLARRWSRSQEVPWEAIVSIGDDHIVVRPAGPARS